MKALTYIEIDTPAFAETSPPGSEQTWRFAIDSEHLPPEIEAIPSLVSVDLQPAIVSLGENLGQRASLRATFRDHRHIMNGEPFEQGTFWGKWRARYGLKLRGVPLRLIRGTAGQALEDMETWHFVVEATDGPGPRGQYMIAATDLLKFTSSDRALAPRPTNGFLVSSITDSDVSATLGPSGIGNAQYSSSGYVNIAGKEVCAFTRSGDALTLTRNTVVPGFAFETEVSAHDAGSRVQLCLPYVAQDPADIVADLLTTYAGVPSEYVPIDAWRDETAAFLNQVYTTLITEPTGVDKLVSELVEQAALAVWWDAKVLLMRLQVLRGVATGAASFEEDEIIQGSLRVEDQPGKRLSEAMTYFALRNPLKSAGDPDNYRSAALTVDAESEAAYRGPANKIIFSRWVPFGGRTVALRLNDLLLSRYRNPPRRFNFAVMRDSNAPLLGAGYRLGWTGNQDMQGNRALAPIQVTRIDPRPDRYEVEAEEMLFDAIAPADLLNRVIVIDSAINNVNLRTLHDTLYPPITEDDVSASPPVTLQCVIESGVIVGSTSTGNAAFDVGSWPVGFVPQLEVKGRIQGRGGDGAGSISTGSRGGAALRARHAVDLVCEDGEVWGGGGGGGAGFQQGIIFTGGGGAGQIPGAAGGSASQPGTTESGGDGSNSGGFPRGGDGGNPGQAGSLGIGASGGSAGGNPGAAIDGKSFVTIIGGAGDRRGPEIN